MFTGLIKEVAPVMSWERSAQVRRLGVRSVSLEDQSIGDSIAVNGVCLSVSDEDTEQNLLYFDLLDKTLRGSNLSSLEKGDLLNLEPALKLSDRLGGHFVMGHVDSQAMIMNMTEKGPDHIMEIELPHHLRALAVEKGSIAMDGISLTIVSLFERSFTVHVIPHTWKFSNLKTRQVGDKVNLEMDLLGKYILRIQMLR